MNRIIPEIIDWRAAAIADGWELKPTYGYEDVSRAASLERDGFKAMVLTRDPAPATKHLAECRRHEYTLNIWGPDGLAIAASYPYSWEKIQAGTLKCMDCGKTVDKTQRVGFAGRVCAACLPAAKKRDEYPGWCD